MNIWELPLAIPTLDEKNRLSLGEGNTLLIKSRGVADNSV